MATTWMLILNCVLGLCQAQNSLDLKNKPVYQSETYNGRGPEFAVDGDENTTSFAVSEEGKGPAWWMVDLQAIYAVKFIGITIIANDPLGGLFAFNVTVGNNTRDPKVNPVVIDYPQGQPTIQHGTPYRVSIQPPVYGRVVGITKHDQSNNGDPYRLSLGEVELHAEYDSELPDTTPNSIPSTTMPVTSASTYTSPSAEGENKPSTQTVDPSNTGIDSKSILPLIVGVVLGILILVIVVIVIIIVVLRRRRAKRSCPDEDTENTSDSERSSVSSKIVQNETQKNGIKAKSPSLKVPRQGFPPVPAGPVPVGPVAVGNPPAGHMPSLPEQDLPETDEEDDLMDNPPDSSLYENLPKKPINVTDLFNHVKKYRMNNQMLFTEEFNDLPPGALKTCQIGGLQENQEKNRFKNIRPYDDNWVKLDTAAWKIQSDYFNGSYVTGYKNKPKCYIATQGPKAGMVDDFWRMVWQEKSTCILMLTKTMENFQKKCEVYWPEGVGEEIQSTSGVKIKTISTELYGDYAQRLLQVSKGFETRQIHHLQFLQWPDKLVPEHPFPLLAFRAKVKSLQTNIKGPIIVHCSAGVGRTGSYIAIDCLIQQALAEKRVDVISMVTQMRLQRMKMVQTEKQYVFVYDAVLDAVTTGETAIPCDKFNKVVKSLKVDGNTPSIKKQFQLLEKTRPYQKMENAQGLSPENIDKNRVKGIIASDKFRPFLMTPSKTGTDYINAVLVDSYYTEREVVATQHPMYSTEVDFWRLVYDCRCQTIVVLNDRQKNDKECPQYWPVKEETTKGPFTLQFVRGGTEKGIRYREIQITYNREGTFKRSEPPFSVKMFHANWGKGENFPATAGFLTLFDVVEAWRKQINKGKTIVHCGDGATRTGLFCAARYMLEKMRVDQLVDPFLAARVVYQTRPEFISMEAEYRYMYDLARDYLASYETYSNFQ